MKNSYYLLNPVFLLALFLLLFNDFYLKAAFPSFLSGKLSDLSGIVVFVFFFTFLFGERSKSAIFIVTTLLFCIWKSSLSKGFILQWNELFSFYAIDRTIDYSDLFCLPVLIPVYFYKANTFQFNQQRLVIPVLMVSMFAIAATSKGGRINAYSASQTYLIDKSFKLEMTRADFFKGLSFSNIVCEQVENGKPDEKASDPQVYVLRNFVIHEGLVVEAMYISIREKKKHLLIDLHKIVVQDEQPGKSKELRKRIASETREYFSKSK